MLHTRDYIRHQTWRKAIRKRNLCEWMYATYWINGEERKGHLFDNLHQYADNKIHCSCGMCCAKTNNKTKRRVPGNYSPSRNYKHNELKQIIDMEQQMDEIGDE